MKPFAVPGFLPVIPFAGAPDALPVVEALLAEKVNAAELPFCGETTPETLRTIRGKYPEMILGAGRVTTPEQCREAAAAGAQFISMPYFREDIARWCVEQGVEAIPTCFNASEIAQARDLGVETVQICFSGAAAGIETLREYFALFPEVKIIPAGKVRPEDLPMYIASPAVATVRADWICAGGEAAQIRGRCRQARKDVMGYELAHVGINCQDEEECQRVVQLFTTLFGFPSWDNGNSIYTSDRIEVMKFRQIGSLGHLAIRSNSVERAAQEFSERGMTAIESTAKYRDGRLCVVYYKEEIGHFGIHLIQRNV